MTLYDQDLVLDSTHRIGVFYGEQPSTLAVQVAKVLCARWSHLLLQQGYRSNPAHLEITFAVSRRRQLLLVFGVPKQANHRAVAQWFGAWARKLKENLAVARSVAH